MVPDVLFEKELKARHSHLLDLGLKIKILSDEAVDMQKNLLPNIDIPVEWISWP